MKPLEAFGIEAVDDLDHGREEQLAAKLAVGDDRQTHLLLHAQHVRDGAVLELSKLVGGYALAARRQQVRRSEKAADIVGAKGVQQPMDDTK